MIQDVRLYINNRLVDFSNELSLPFTYQLEDLNNPTIIKNSFTKTITIVGTKNNNRIFGEIYNLDREQLYDETYIVGSYFNPSYRTPFTLYRNGEMIETGYMQLNNVTLKAGIINYNITLYGGLGDFFYNLSYNSDNEPLQLKDLKYGEELAFKINKKIVKESWENLIGSRKTTASTVTDYFTFIPSYNGMYEDFDNDKVLINTYNSEVFPYSSSTIDGVTYIPYRGFMLGELNKEYTEWEMRSLMSYKQRPALKFSKFVEACCDPENNGGYEVELDDSFFNPSNPYYDKAYIALPLLEEKIDGEQESTEDNVKLVGGFVGVQNGISALTTGALIRVVNDNITMNDEGIINTQDMTVSTTFDINLDIQMFFDHTFGVDWLRYKDDLYLSCATTKKFFLNSVLVYIEAVDVDRSTVVGTSDYFNFTSKTNRGNNVQYGGPHNWKNWNNVRNIPIQDVFGHFVWNESINKHYFKSDEGGNTFRIELKNCKKADNIRFKLIMKILSNRDNDIFYLYRNKFFNQSKDPEETQISQGWWNCLADSQTSKLIIKGGDVDISSGQKITQDILLKTEKTPCDFLLSYCKLFGLYFSRNIPDKKIEIMKRNNYFTGNIVDISKRIDYSKDFVINPILYDKKFYRLSLEGNDSYVNDKYKNEYGVEYGQKRINTNYNFNSETTELLENNVYQNVISMVDTSPYYRTFFNSAGTQQPAFIVDNLSYKKYNVIGYVIDNETSFDVIGKDYIDLSKTVDWNTRGGYDYNDKLCCYSKDEEKSLADLSAALVFYDGSYTVTDLDGNEVQYWLTDDVPEMFTLNEGQCHIYTEDEFDFFNNWVAWKIPYLPKFSRYRMSENKVVDSWDFAQPKEIYIPNTTYDNNVTLYEQYWSKLYMDKLDINTKKVTAYVNLNGLNVNANLLKDFYFFNNCFWVLNKIENYDINNHNTVKCEFIKINDTINYTTDLGKRYDYFYAEKENFVVPYTSGYVTTKIHSTTPWEIGWYNDSRITRVYPMSGDAGTTQITIFYKETDVLYDDENFYISLTTENNVKEKFSIDIKQQPNPENVVKLSGTIKYWSGALIPNGRILIGNPLRPAEVYNSRYLDTYTGEYELYVPKGVEVYVEIQKTNSSVVRTEKRTFYEDTIYNQRILDIL